MLAVDPFPDTSRKGEAWLISHCPINCPRPSISQTWRIASTGAAIPDFPHRDFAHRADHTRHICRPDLSPRSTQGQLCATVCSPRSGLPAETVNGVEVKPGGTWRHILGTDKQGRDMLSRIIYGARVSLTVSLIAVFIAGVIGTAPWDSPPATSAAASDHLVMRDRRYWLINTGNPVSPSAGVRHRRQLSAR